MQTNQRTRAQIKCVCIRHMCKYPPAKIYKKPFCVCVSASAIRKRDKKWWKKTFSFAWAEKRAPNRWKKNYVEKFWNWYKKRENTNTGWERWVETKINLLCKLSRCVYLFVLCVGTRMRAILRATCSSHLNWIVLWVARIHFRFERCLDRETSSKLRNSRKVNIYCITLLSFNMSSYFGFQIPRYT